MHVDNDRLPMPPRGRRVTKAMTGASFVTLLARMEHLLMTPYLVKYPQTPPGQVRFAVEGHWPYEIRAMNPHYLAPCRRRY